MLPRRLCSVWDEYGQCAALPKRAAIVYARGRSALKGEMVSVYRGTRRVASFYEGRSLP